MSREHFNLLSVLFPSEKCACKFFPINLSALDVVPCSLIESYENFHWDKNFCLVDVGIIDTIKRWRIPVNSLQYKKTSSDFHINPFQSCDVILSIAALSASVGPLLQRSISMPVIDSKYAAEAPPKPPDAMPLDR